MPLIETGPGLWERLDDAPVAPEAPSDEAGERSDREQLSARVHEALRDGSLDELEDAIVRETVGYLTDPYIDSNTLMGVQDLNPRLAAAWNNGARDLGKDERRREVSRARILSVFAPPAHNAVRQHQNYVIGQGIPKPTAAIGNADIQAVIDDLWSDPANYEFATHNGQKRADANQIIDGELFVAIAIDEQDGHCKWRTVDPLDIDDLVTDPDDANRVLYYRVRQAKMDYDFGRGIAKDTDAQGKYVYFRDWRNTDPALDPYNGKAQPAAPDHMVMAHWPINTLGLRGIPDMVCAAPWIAAHKSFMNNRTILHEALSKIAFVKTVKGGQPQVSASALAEQSSLTNSQYSGQERNPQPAPYAIMTKNAGVDIEQLKVDSGASNAQTDGEMLAQMFSTGVGLPTHYSIMSVEAHRLATATAMELPVLKMFLSSQQGWLDMLRDLIDFALLQAALAKRIKAKIVKKHGRQLIDWDNSPASPATVSSDDQPAAPSNVTPMRRKKAAPDSEAQASVREALEDTDAVAQAEHIEKAQEPTAQDEQAQKKRGHYTIDMPPILQKDVAQTITAVVKALQAGTLTPELAANQVMIALGFDDVSDKMDEWRSYVQTQAQQAVDRAAQEHDMAQQQLSAKAGPPGGGPSAPPSNVTPFPRPAVPGAAVAAREAFTEAQLAVLAEAGLTLVREAGGGGHWITIEQDGESTHIFIGAHGMVTKGPKHLIGANIAHLPPIPGKRSVTHHPDGHVPAGHDSHPHYTEHQDKKHVYGKHGPGVGYDVDNPLPKKTAEQAEEGLQKSVTAAKEHKAAQDAEQAKADAETKAKADEAEKKAQIGQKNSEALASAHEHKPFVVTQHPESGKYHVTNGLTATSHTTHDTEADAQDMAKIKNDSHYNVLQKMYNDDEADKATSTHPYVKQTLTPGKFSVVNTEDYKAHSEHDDEEDADKALHEANNETYKAFLKKANEDNQKAIDATTPEQPYCAVINKPGEYVLYNGQTETETGHEPYDSLDEAKKNAESLNKQKVQAKTDKLHMTELLGHASTVHGQHYLMTLADHTLFGDSASTLTTAEKDGLETLSTFLFNKANGKPEATTNQLHDAIVKAALPLLETHSQNGAEVMQQAQDNMPSLQQTIAHEEAKASAAPKAASAAAAQTPAAAPKAYQSSKDVPVTTLKDGIGFAGGAHVVKLLVGDENGAHCTVGAVDFDGKAPNEDAEQWYVRAPQPASGNTGATVTGFTKKDAVRIAQHVVADQPDKLNDQAAFHDFVAQVQKGTHAGNVLKAQEYNAKSDALATTAKPWVVNKSTQKIGLWHAWNSQTGTIDGEFGTEKDVQTHVETLNAGHNSGDYLKQKYGAKHEQRERWREEAKASLPKPADTAKLAKKSQVGKVRTKVKPDEAKRGREFLAEQHKDVTDGEAKEQIMVQQAERMRALGITDADVTPFLNELRLGAGYAPDHELDTPLESAANYLTAMWARSSADSHEISLAMQQVARDLFGQDAWTDRPDHVGDGAWNQATQRANDPAFRKAAEAYLHSSYHATQAAFKEAGITHIAVYRGVTNVPTPSIVDNFNKAKASTASTYDHWQTYGEVSADEAWTNPLSSWAFASQIPSKNFAGDNKEWQTQPNVVYYGMMPVSHIVSTFRSGYGCKLEDECVVIGHRTPLAYTVGRESINTYMNLDKKLGAT